MTSKPFTVTITRGARVTSEYLDVEEVPRIQFQGVPAELHDRLTGPEADGSGTTGQPTCVGRIRSLTPKDLLPGDHLINEQTGATYVITTRKSISLSGGGTRLELLKISGRAI